MREGHIYVRTIAGLKRADVLWRHVDADWCDPVELNPASRIGVPGLIEAIRARRRRGRKHAGLRPARIARACWRSCRVSPAACSAPISSCRTSPPGGAASRPNVTRCSPRSTRSPSPARSAIAFRASATSARSSAPSCRATTGGGWRRISARAASTTSDRTSCGFRRRRDGKTDSLFRALSCCASTPPPRRTAGASCPAASAGCPANPTRARSRWAKASNRPTSGCSATARSRPPACCRPPKRRGSCACSAIFPAAPPTTSSGSAAISSARRRLCGWSAAFAAARSTLTRRPTARANRWTG